MKLEAPLLAIKLWLSRAGLVSSHYYPKCLFVSWSVGHSIGKHHKDDTRYIMSHNILPFASSKKQNSFFFFFFRQKSGKKLLVKYNPPARVSRNELIKGASVCHRNCHHLVFFIVWKSKAMEDDCCGLYSSVTQPRSEREPVYFLQAVSHWQ